LHDGTHVLFSILKVKFMPILRKARFAGTFYTEKASTIEAFFKHTLRNIEEHGKVSCKAVIVPHAGYIYSGRVAVKTLGLCNIPKYILLLGPNHTGVGAKAALSSADYWETLFGNIPCSKELGNFLIESCPIISLDDKAHFNEHSLEVELPILKYLNPDIHIAALTLSLLSKKELEVLGKSILSAFKQYKNSLLVVVSSDMSHYVSVEEAKILDDIALERISKLDPSGLYDTVKKKNLTMCGFIPATALLFALQKMGNIKASIVDYTTSAEVTGDPYQVVAYAGVLFR